VILAVCTVCGAETYANKAIEGVHQLCIPCTIRENLLLHGVVRKRPRPSGKTDAQRARQRRANLNKRARKAAGWPPAPPKEWPLWTEPADPIAFAKATSYVEPRFFELEDYHFFLLPWGVLTT